MICKSTAISPHALVECLIQEFTQIRCHHIRSSQMHDQVSLDIFGTIELIVSTLTLMCRVSSIFVLPISARAECYGVFAI